MSSQKVALPCICRTALSSGPIFLLLLDRPAALSFARAGDLVVLAGVADGARRSVQAAGDVEQRLAFGPQLADLFDLDPGQRATPPGSFGGIRTLKVDMP